MARPTDGGDRWLVLSIIAIAAVLLVRNRIACVSELSAELRNVAVGQGAVVELARIQ